MRKKTRQYRTVDELKYGIVNTLTTLSCGTRLEIARFMGLSKSPHLIKAINELVANYEIIEVRQWLLNRRRFQLMYFPLLHEERENILTSKEDKWIAARPIVIEHYIDAQGGLLGKWDWKETHQACECGYDALVRFRSGKECWDECMTCGLQHKSYWNKE